MREGCEGLIDIRGDIQHMAPEQSSADFLAAFGFQESLPCLVFDFPAQQQVCQPCSLQYLLGISDDICGHDLICLTDTFDLKCSPICHDSIQIAWTAVALHC